MSISSIHTEIASLRQKIENNRNLISKIEKLVGDATNASTSLKTTSENLNAGLIIDGKSADQGKLSEIAIRLDKNISSLGGAVSTATQEIKTYEQEITSLEAEKRRLEAIEAENARKAKLLEENGLNNNLY